MRTVDIDAKFHDNRNFIIQNGNRMNQVIYCSKLKQELPGLKQPPFPGPLGERIHHEISLKAWDMWMNHQTMLVNEYRLSLIDPKAREFLRKEMENFFFGDGSEKPSGYVPKE